MTKTKKKITRRIKKTRIRKDDLGEVWLEEIDEKIEDVQ